jgi:hypothetical protein
MDFAPLDDDLWAIFRHRDLIRNSTHKDIYTFQSDQKLGNDKPIPRDMGKMTNQRKREDLTWYGKISWSFGFDRLALRDMGFHLQQCENRARQSIIFTPIGFEAFACPFWE